MILTLSILICNGQTPCTSENVILSNSSTNLITATFVNANFNTITQIQAQRLQNAVLDTESCPATIVNSTTLNTCILTQNTTIINSKIQNLIARDSISISIFHSTVSQITGNFNEFLVEFSEIFVKNSQISSAKIVNSQVKFDGVEVGEIGVIRSSNVTVSADLLQLASIGEISDSDVSITFRQAVQRLPAMPLVTGSNLSISGEIQLNQPSYTTCFSSAQNSEILLYVTFLADFDTGSDVTFKFNESISSTVKRNLIFDSKVENQVKNFNFDLTSSTSQLVFSNLQQAATCKITSPKPDSYRINGQFTGQCPRGNAEISIPEISIQIQISTLNFPFSLKSAEICSPSEFFAAGKCLREQICSGNQLLISSPLACVQVRLGLEIGLLLLAILLFIAFLTILILLITCRKRVFVAFSEEIRPVEPAKIRQIVRLNLNESINSTGSKLVKSEHSPEELVKGGIYGSGFVAKPRVKFNRVEINSDDEDVNEDYLKLMNEHMNIKNETVKTLYQGEELLDDDNLLKYMTKNKGVVKQKSELDDE